MEQANSKVAASAAWRDQFKAESKELNRAANFLNSALQQGKAREEMLVAAQSRLTGPPLAHVSDLLADSESLELIKEKVGALNKVAGALQRAADRGDAPGDAISFAHNKGVAQHPGLLKALDAAVAEQRAPEGAAGASAAPSTSTAQVKPLTALEANRELVLEASDRQIDASSQRAEQPDAAAAREVVTAQATATIEGASTASVAKAQREEPAAVKQGPPQPAKSASHPARPTTVQGAGQQAKDVTRAAEAPTPQQGSAPGPRQVDGQGEQARVAAERGRGSAEAPESAAPLRSNPAGERPGAEPEPSGLRNSSQGPSRGEAAPAERPVDTKRIEVVQPSEVRASGGLAHPQSGAPTKEMSEAKPVVAREPGLPATVVADKNSPAVGKLEPSRDLEKALAAPSPAPAAVPRATLEQTLAEHMRSQGFDREAVSKVGEIAAAVRANANVRPEGQSVVVLHKSGEALATATTERSAAQVARQGDTVVFAKTLEHIAEKGLNLETVRNLRAAAPNLPVGTTNLEVADRAGRDFLERADRSVQPRDAAQPRAAASAQPAAAPAAAELGDDTLKRRIQEMRDRTRQVSESHHEAPAISREELKREEPAARELERVKVFKLGGGS
ncbi:MULTISPECIES: hypothetical protein [unclassified Variovorax]|uniref:hypothetical protein n=1 Tax=unclassified Variovorax TaxID=663243 RepID=UPI0013A535E9|nr:MULTISPECIES: hypothetical protein [unclassified Variovorax]